MTCNQSLCLYLYTLMYAFKQYIIYIIFNIWFVQAYGQVQVGAKVAYSLSFAKSQFLLFEDAEDLLQYEVRFLEDDIRPMYGIMSYYEQEKVFVQLEALFRQSSARFTSIDWSTIERKATNQTKKTSALWVPFLAGYKYERLKLGLGPIFTFVLNENTIFDGFSNFKERREALEMGFGFNCGLQVLRLHIDVNYEHHFNKVADYIIFREQQNGFAQSPGFLTIGLSYLIF